MNKKDQLAELEKQRRKLQEEIEEEDRKERIERLKPLRELAIQAHNLFCSYNHTDGCCWGYEEDQKDKDKMWECWSHKNYLQKVECLIKDKGFTIEQLKIIFDKFKELKNIEKRFKLIIHHF